MAQRARAKNRQALGSFRTVLRDVILHILEVSHNTNLMQASQVVS